MNKRQLNARVKSLKTLRKNLVALAKSRSVIPYSRGQYVAACTHVDEVIALMCDGYWENRADV